MFVLDIMIFKIMAEILLKRYLNVQFYFPKYFAYSVKKLVTAKTRF